MSAYSQEIARLEAEHNQVELVKAKIEEMSKQI